MHTRRIHTVRTIFAVAVASALSFAACKPAADTSKVATDSAAPANPANYKRIAVGDAAPMYLAQTLAGDSVRLGASNEPVTVMNVWATWCTSCREEMQDLQKLQDDYKSRGVRVVGVSVDESDGARVKKFVEREKLTFPIVHDQEGRVQGLYQVAGIPNTFIVNKDGKILWKSIGNLHGVVDSLRRVLDGVAQ